MPTGCKVCPVHNLLCAKAVTLIASHQILYPNLISLFYYFCKQFHREEAKVYRCRDNGRGGEGGEKEQFRHEQPHHGACTRRGGGVPQEAQGPRAQPAVCRQGLGGLGELQEEEGAQVQEVLLEFDSLQCSN